MRYIQGISREQVTLFPETIDEYITDENPVRFIEAFVGNLDLVGMEFTYSETKDTGRKPYNPGDLLKLYIYGYLSRIRSSRQLERECNRNVELMWLMRKLRPDFKTIADFRRDNVKAIKGVCREFLLLCKKLDLFGTELIAIDGSKFSAVNSNNRSYTKKKIEKVIKNIDKEISEYIRILDKNDNKENVLDDSSVTGIKEKIEYLKKRKEEIKDIEEKIESSVEGQVNLTDPDSRMMKTNRGNDVSYNVQIATESKNKLIVSHEVTNDINDQNQLSNMAVKAKQFLGVEELEVVADKGYYKDMEIKKCYDEKIECYVPKPESSNNKSLGLYTKDDFRYDTENDCYICPAGEKLKYQHTVEKLGKELKVYSTKYCKECKQKPQCTRMQRNRRIYRWVHEEIIEEMRRKTLNNGHKVDLRKSLVEHPFGTIKHWMGYDSFLVRGSEKVSSEMSLIVLMYNIKRAINILGVKKLIKALT
ncbi:IS1182 family transposase [candidate division KSB1 bacterium]